MIRKIVKIIILFLYVLDVMLEQILIESIGKNFIIQLEVYVSNAKFGIITGKSYRFPNY